MSSRKDVPEIGIGYDNRKETGKKLEKYRGEVRHWSHNCGLSTEASQRMIPGSLDPTTLDVEV